MVIREDQAHGQRILSYSVMGPGNATISTGSSVGNKRIDLFAPLSMGGTTSGSDGKVALTLKVHATAMGLPPVLAQFAAFAPCPSG